MLFLKSLVPTTDIPSIHEGDTMRKILLATTALVGVAFGTASVAHAATSPITVTVGGIR